MQTVERRHLRSSYLQTGRRRFCTVVWRRLRNVWEKRLGKFLKTDGTSVFDEEDETKLKENVADNIESFVNDYNYLMKRLAQSGDIVDSNYAKKLKNYANAENKELREIGITIKGDGTLELDENKLKAADISQVKKLFTGEDGFAKKVSNLSGQIGKYAKEKVTELEKQVRRRAVIITVMHAT